MVIISKSAFLIFKYLEFWHSLIIHINHFKWVRGCRASLGLHFETKFSRIESCVEELEWLTCAILQFSSRTKVKNVALKWHVASKLTEIEP